MLFVYQGVFPCDLNISFDIIIEGKLGLDVGQPGIPGCPTRATRVNVDTPWYHQLVVLVVPRPNLVFLYIFFFLNTFIYPEHTI